MSNLKDRVAADDPAEVLLRQLLHLKKYERPETARMTRSKQNIMRQVREASSQKRWSLGDLLELNIPWFFAEPRYGVALLFVVFAGLQFWGASSREQPLGDSGTYAPVVGNIPGLEQTSTLSTNQVSYPELPRDYQLFPDARRNGGSVKFVGRLEEKK